MSICAHGSPCWTTSPGKLCTPGTSTRSASHERGGAWTSPIHPEKQEYLGHLNTLTLAGHAACTSVAPTVANECLCQCTQAGPYSPLTALISGFLGAA